MPPPVKRRRVNGNDAATSPAAIAVAQAQVYELPLATLQHLLITAIPKNPNLMAKVAQAHGDIFPQEQGGTRHFDGYRKKAFELLNDERPGNQRYRSSDDASSQIEVMLDAILEQVTRETPYNTRRNAMQTIVDILSHCFVANTIVARFVRRNLGDGWGDMFGDLFLDLFTGQERSRLAGEQYRPGITFLDQLTELAIMAEEKNMFKGLADSLWYLEHPLDMETEGTDEERESEKEPESNIEQLDLYREEA